MPSNKVDFQPGSILADVLVGAFRVSGTTFDQWCHANGVTQGNARNAAFGMSRSPQARIIVKAMIEAAGRDFVRDAYLRRLREHLAQFGEAA